MHETARPSAATFERIAAHGLGLAAAPALAACGLMAFITPSASLLCAPSSGPLPFHDMAFMYLLMSLFHLPAWLSLVGSHAGRHMTRKQG